MWRRFLVYGAIGWSLEVLMTGAASVLFGRDRFATARTYLWMYPIYGAGGLLLERVGRRLRRWPRPARWLAYVHAIYGVEYTSGWLLRRAIGGCPWDYGCHRYGVSGLIRVDYAPLWLMVAASFEPVRDLLWETEAAAAASAGPPIAETEGRSHVEGGVPREVGDGERSTQGGSAQPRTAA